MVHVLLENTGNPSKTDFDVVHALGRGRIDRRPRFSLFDAGQKSFVWPVMANGLIIHMLGVGLPSSLFARAGRANQ
jgi:cytochrome b subunit of formate dehydrogenase